MGYKGIVATVSMGKGGLHTDDPQDMIPPTDLILATNLSYGLQMSEKEPGSERWNAYAALPDAVVAFVDWWPAEFTQRVIAVCADGKVYRFTDRYNYTEVTAGGTAPTSLTINGQVCIVPGGNETGSNARKLFILTGNDPIQVIEADGTTRTNLSSPAADWPDTGTSFPTFGLIHRSRFFVFGDKNNGHRLYGSNPNDHEDFTTLNAIYTENVYPGEGERLLAGIVYKGRFFFFKTPAGAYYLNDADTTFTNWFSEKLSSSFGAASSMCAVQGADDLFVANTEGSVTSLKAVQAFGDVESSDIFQILKNESYMREISSQLGIEDRWGLYYPDKKMVMYTYRGAGSLRNNYIAKIDLSIRDRPRVSWSDKDQPNCLGLIKDIQRVQRPYYGSDDGYIYFMDAKDRWVTGLSAPVAPVAALAGAGAGNVDDGDHYYRVTFVSGATETDGGFVSASVTVADQSVDGQIALTSIPIDVSGVATSRKLYRRSLTNTTFKLLTTIADNTTTTYTDNIATASLGADCPLTNGFHTAYSSTFQTPHMDMSHLNPAAKETHKLWDFLEITFEPTGRWNLSAEVYIDGVYSETITFEVSHGFVLDDFELDTNRLSDRIPRSIRKPLHGMGRRISFKFFNSGLGENVRIQGFSVYFRTGAQGQTAQEP